MELTENFTTNICDTLFARLSEQGLISVEIPKLIGEVVDLIGSGGFFTVASINQKLEQLGWKKGIIDAITFELILFVLKYEYSYEVEGHNLH